MEQDEPDVVELQDSDEGDVVRRVFIGEGGNPKSGWGGVEGLQITQKSSTENSGGIWILLRGLQANLGGPQAPQEWGAGNLGGSRCTPRRG